MKEINSLSNWLKWQDLWENTIILEFLITQEGSANHCQITGIPWVLRQKMLREKIHMDNLRLTTEIYIALLYFKAISYLVHNL